MAAATPAGGKLGGPSDGGQGGAPPEVQPGPRAESILTASVNDQETDEDGLGFTPYAEALAAFLTNPATQTPLTISVEGRWGSGKSSFMRQLMKQIANAEDSAAEAGRQDTPLVEGAIQPVAARQGASTMGRVRPRVLREVRKSAGSRRARGATWTCSSAVSTGKAGGWI